MVAYLCASTAGRFMLKMLVHCKQIRSSWLCTGSSLFAPAPKKSGSSTAPILLLLRKSFAFPFETLMKNKSRESYTRTRLIGSNMWRFQPPAASHMSGVWERLIRKLRKAMNAVLSKLGAVIPLKILCTVFYEVASILNSRPICQASDDLNDMEPLTPNHLLLQRRNLAIPQGIFAKRELYSRKNGGIHSSLPFFWSPPTVFGRSGFERTLPT